MNVMSDLEIISAINKSKKAKSIILMGREITNEELMSIAKRSNYTHLSVHKSVLTVEKDRDLRLAS